ncbi:hypothetical protein Tco_1369284 [Tanacetum coccineum]
MAGWRWWCDEVMVVVCSGFGGSSGGDCVSVVEMMMLVSVWCIGSCNGDGGLGVEMAEMEVVAYWCWWVGSGVGWRGSHDGGDDVDVVTGCKLLEEAFACRDLEAAFEHSGGSPAGIHGLFSGWYCGLASRKVTLRVSMAWAKGVIILRMLRLERVASETVGLHAKSFS